MHEALVLALLAGQPHECMMVRDNGEGSICEVVLILFDAPHDGQRFLFSGGVATLSGVKLPAGEGNRMFHTIESLRQDACDTLITRIGLQDEGTLEVGRMQTRLGHESILEGLHRLFARFVEVERHVLLSACTAEWLCARSHE